MRPIAFITTEERKIKFIYKLSELKEWIARGEEHGDCGFLLVGRDGKFEVYIGYGTIERPSTWRKTIKLVHCPVFDGKRATPEEIIAEPVYEKDPFISHSMYFLDLGKH